ncbi:MAG: hypothetical protein OXE99_14785 [Cellvibrionales bacterium]|nr:hypothetical protein [Cellvibrionales bacterium]
MFRLIPLFLLINLSSCVSTYLAATDSCTGDCFSTALEMELALTPLIIEDIRNENAKRRTIPVEKDISCLPSSTKVCTLTSGCWCK